VLEEPIFALEALTIVSLLVASIVAVVVRRIRIPYTVALVLVGLFVAVQGDQLVIQFIPGISLVLYEPIPGLVHTVLDFDPEFILAVFIPPIIFEAAFHLEFDHLRSNLVPILILAVPGVILSTLIIGGIISLTLGLSLVVAAVFGALISATDPVAVVALFRDLGVSRRLSVAVEGESLFNDGIAIVVFDIALAAALALTLAEAGAEAGADVKAFTPIDGLVEFVWVSLGGLGIGALLAWLVSGLIFRVDDYFVEITLTAVLAYGAYLVADEVGVSGVLAVVAAGIVAGTRGRPGMSPTTKIVLFSFWEYVAFLANSLIFLLIGITINIAQLVPLFRSIMVAVVAVVVARAIVVYGLLWLARLAGSESRVPMNWRHVFFWGGFQLMAFGVVLFTLLGQGTTIQFLLQRLGLSEQPEHIVAREMQLGRLYAAQAGLSRLADLRHDGLLVGEVWDGLRDEYYETSRQLSDEMVQLFVEYPDLEREILVQARREALQAERAALSDAMRRGLISEHVYRELTREVDDHLDALTIIREATTSTTAAPEE
jgi:CPA1 family monovalent cation:H+ antiporter